MYRMKYKVPTQPILYKEIQDYHEIELVWNALQKKNKALLYRFSTGDEEGKKVKLLPDCCPDLLISYNKEDVHIDLCHSRIKLEELRLEPNRNYIGFKPYSSCAFNTILDEKQVPLIREKILDQGVFDHLNKSLTMDQLAKMISKFVQANLLDDTYRPNLVEYAEIAICHSNGELKVEKLCKELQYSPGYCRERFKEMTRASIKQACDVLRFQKVLHLMEREPKRTLCELAHEAGYFDQPHMIRGFKKNTGLSPHKFRKVYYQ